MRGGVRIVREVYINVTTESGEFMGGVTYDSYNSTGDDLYHAEVAHGVSKSFNAEEDAVAYIEECWEARTTSEPSIPVPYVAIGNGEPIPPVLQSLFDSMVNNWGKK